jgi:hypothetical protein
MPSLMPEATEMSSGGHPADGGPREPYAAGAILWGALRGAYARRLSHKYDCADICAGLTGSLRARPRHLFG